MSAVALNNRETRNEWITKTKIDIINRNAWKSWLKFALCPLSVGWWCYSVAITLNSVEERANGGTAVRDVCSVQTGIGKSCVQTVCVSVGSRHPAYDYHCMTWNESRKKKRTNNKSTNSSLECYIGPDGGKQSFRILLLLLATSTCNSHWFNKSAPHIKTIHTPALSPALSLDGPTATNSQGSCFLQRMPTANTVDPVGKARRYLNLFKFISVLRHSPMSHITPWVIRIQNGHKNKNYY